jgi:hypothetical protein
MRYAAPDLAGAADEFYQLKRREFIAALGGVDDALRLLGDATPAVLRNNGADLQHD